jgi:hypothetical protein
MQKIDLEVADERRTRYAANLGSRVSKEETGGAIVREGVFVVLVSLTLAYLAEVHTCSHQAQLE